MLYNNTFINSSSKKMETQEKNTATDTPAITSVAPVENETNVTAPADATDAQTAKAPDDYAAVSQDDLCRLIAEAEQRGYLRGRNQQIEELIMKPDDLYGLPDGFDSDLDNLADDSCPGFLSHIRSDFWD